MLGLCQILAAIEGFISHFAELMDEPFLALPRTPARCGTTGWPWPGAPATSVRSSWITHAPAGRRGDSEHRSEHGSRAAGR
jgi:hypothetical protein